MHEDDLSKLSPEEKKRWLFKEQKALLDNFLQTGAISKAQYETSLNGLITKMHIDMISKNN